MDGHSPDQDPANLLHSFAQRLNNGEVIAFPTETFYGLLARLDRPAAVERIFTLKGRGRDAPLPVIAADADAACSLWREVTPAARTLIAAFWPGPLTLVLPANRERVSPRVTGGTDGVGVRVPGRAAARGLAAMAGGALIATSANRSAEPPARSAAEVRAYFGDEVPVVDGGTLEPSRGSTVLSLLEWPPVLWRDGDCDRLALERVLGVTLRP